MTIRGLLLDQPSRPPSKSTDQVLPMMQQNYDDLVPLLMILLLLPKGNRENELHYDFCCCYRLKPGTGDDLRPAGAAPWIYKAVREFIPRSPYSMFGIPSDEQATSCEVGV